MATGLEITIDRARCIGSGNCGFWAPNTFDLDDEGVAFVLDAADDDEQLIRKAAEGCPTRAISVVAILRCDSPKEGDMDELIPVDWAGDLDTSEVLEAASAISASPNANDLVELAGLVAEFASRLDVPRARASVTDDEPRALLGRTDAGALLALRWYAPGEVSTVHHHAWTVIFELEGTGAFERWVEDGDQGPSLSITERVDVGATIRIGEGELHRQRAGDQGALELVLIGDFSPDRPRVDVEPGAAQ